MHDYFVLHAKRIQLKLTHHGHHTSDLSPRSCVEISQRDEKSFRCRRVHISADTLKCLNDIYEVEPGYGSERDNYLKDRNVVTYLIKQVEPLRSRRKYSARPKALTEEDAANKNKKSFKMNNALAANSNAPNSNVDDDIGVDWTPEIPFENVSIGDITNI